jgi:glycosyltransferase involved in cell wall biosynthesis
VISERNADTVNAFGVKTSVHRNLSSASALHHATTIGDVSDSNKTRVAPLRVLKVTQSYFPFVERGGPAVKVRSLARGLARRGHSVSVLTSDLGIEGLSNPALAIARMNKGWRYHEDGVETRYLDSWGGYRSLTWNPGTFEFCRRELASFDIVHIYGTYDLLGPIVAAACGRKGIPYVIEPMGMFRPMVRNLALKRAYRRLFGESVARGAARLVATSVQEEKELIEEGIPPPKISVRRNGIELSQLSGAAGGFRREYGISQAVFLVLFLGRIVEKKSPDLLIDAFARWRSETHGGQDAALIFAGPFEIPSYRRKLEARVRRLGLSSLVRFIGPLYDECKWSALTDADIFVLPSQHENFGNAAAEAVACGTPVVVTDRCGIAPLIEGRAGLVIAHECAALVRALHQLSDATLRESLKLGCGEVARGLSWEQPLAETEALYADVLRSRSAVP